METEYNLEKNPERKYTPRKPSRLVIAAGLVFTIVGTGLSGCSSTNKGGIEESVENPPKQEIVIEQDYKSYVSEVLNKIDANESLPDIDRELLKKIYLGIDMNNLTEEQKRSVNLLSQYKMEGKKIEIGGYEKEVMDMYIPWMDMSNPNSIDILAYGQLFEEDFLEERAARREKAESVKKKIKEESFLEFMLHGFDDLEFFEFKTLTLTPEQIKEIASEAGKDAGESFYGTKKGEDKKSTGKKTKK